MTACAVGEGDQVTDEARNRVAERIAGLQSADERLARALEAVSGWISRVPDGAIDEGPVDGLMKLAAAVREPLPTELAELSPAAQEGASPHALDSDRHGEASAKASHAI